MRYRQTFLIIACLLAFSLPAKALINPKFTPIQLIADASTIVTVKVKGGKAKTSGDRIYLEITGVLKGKAPAHLSIDLSKAPRQHADAARAQFAQFGDEDALFFIGKDENEQAGAFLHIHGMWLRLLPGTDGVYPLDVIDREMPSTWAGGTDMLIRCIHYILKNDDATVPVQAGMEWQSATKIAAVAGAAHEMLPVDLAGDGKPLLFVAADGGDHLFKPNGDAYEDVTAKLKLRSASRLCAWGDFNSDSRLDLASYDGKNVTIWSQQADGTFTAAPATGAALPENCRGMMIIGVRSAKTNGMIAGLLISPPSGPPIVLAPLGNNAFGVTSLPPAPPEMAQNLGASGACVAADFNGDGIVDVIEPFENGGLFYAGKAGGSFDAPKACGVCYGAGGGSAAIADFDGDGLPDLLVAGAQGVKIFQNLGGGNFAEQCRDSGEVAYKSQPRATCCAVGDFNNDARPDMIVGYAAQNPQVFFNRGFRSFGEAPHLELDEAPSQIPGIASGQKLVLLADLTHSGAQDLYVLTSGGDLYHAANSASGDQPTSVAVHVALISSLAGPMTIALWHDQRCLGTAIAQAGTRVAFFGVENAGKYALKWTGADGKPASRDVVIDKAVEVTLGAGN